MSDCEKIIASTVLCAVRIRKHSSSWGYGTRSVPTTLIFSQPLRVPATFSAAALRGRGRFYAKPSDCSRCQLRTRMFAIRFLSCTAATLVGSTCSACSTISRASLYRPASNSEFARYISRVNSDFSGWFRSPRSGLHLGQRLRPLPTKPQPLAARWSGQNQQSAVNIQWKSTSAAGSARNDASWERP